MFILFGLKGLICIKLGALRTLRKGLSNFRQEALSSSHYCVKKSAETLSIQSQSFTGNGKNLARYLQSSGIAELLLIKTIHEQIKTHEMHLDSMGFIAMEFLKKELSSLTDDQKEMILKTSFKEDIHRLDLQL